MRPCKSASPQFGIKCELPLWHDEAHTGEGWTWEKTSAEHKQPTRLQRLTLALAAALAIWCLIGGTIIIGVLVSRWL